MSKPTHAKVVTRGSHQAHTKAFLKLVSSISHREGWREDEVLARWLDASARSMYGAVLRFVRDDERWNANEAEYMRIVERCR